MALVLADRVRETTTVTGTGTATLLGAAPGYQSFSAVGNANTTYYVIANQSATEWEVGIGTYTASGTLLSRDTVLSSSNSGSLVNFSAGTKDVFVDYPAGRAVYEDAAGNVDGYPITGGTINNTTIGGTTPAAGTFTTLTATGQTSLGGVAGSESLRVLTAGASPNAYATVQGSSFSTAYFGFGGSATNGNIYFQSKAAGTITFQTNNGAQTQVNFNHTASAVNYHQLTGSATGSGPIHSVAGSDTNIDLNLTAKGTGSVLLNTGGGKQVDVFNASSAVNWIRLNGNSTGAGPNIMARGGDSAVNLNLSAYGSGAIDLFTNHDSFVRQFRVSHTASAVNYVQVTGNNTTNSPVISVQGSDTNIGLVVSSKGNARIGFFTNNVSTQQFIINHTASAVNYLQVTGGATGVAPVLSAAGSDTNIPAVVQPKGTGALQAQQTDSTATGGNARGANAVDWQTSRSSASQVASGQYSAIVGGSSNTANNSFAFVGSGALNSASGFSSFVGGGRSNTAGGTPDYGTIVAGLSNTSAGFFNFIGGGFTNSGTSGSAVTTQSGTMNATTAVTLSGSNANIKVGQLVTGTSIAGYTYVAAISGTSLTLSQAASGSGTSTLSFYTPHGVVVGGGNNTATGSYSFIGGGGDAGTAANRNVASGDWSVVVGGRKGVASGNGAFVAGGGFGGGSNTASGSDSFIGTGYANTASSTASAVLAGRDNTANGGFSSIVGGSRGSTRGLNAYVTFGSSVPFSETTGSCQSAILVIGAQTTDATATVLKSDGGGAGTTNQVILPNNSAYFFTGEVVAGVTGGGNTKGWTIEGVIKRGANAASTALVGTPTVTSTYGDAGASTWVIAVTADTTNGGLAVTFTGQASTTIRTVAQIRTTEMTY